MQATVTPARQIVTVRKREMESIEKEGDREDIEAKREQEKETWRVCERKRHENKKILFFFFYNS